MTRARRRKHWGWGYEDQQPDRAGLEATAGEVRSRLGFGGERVEEPVALDAIELASPRIDSPPSLARLFSAEPHDRISHGLGKAYRDIVRGLRGQVPHPPDLVARPATEAEIEQVLAWCADANVAAIPYGGGTSVVGGVEPRVDEGYGGAVSLDLGALDRVLEVDAVSRAARIQAGALGPALEDQLREHELTLRHFPQSFEYSTLGGWIATRAGGHFATRLTHIDDLVESVRALTPSGEWASRRLPGSGAGPSPDRMLLGSEGILGVITEAWVRLQVRPRFKVSRGVAFDDFLAGAEAVRELAQSGLDPSNCRLLDPAEVALTHAAPAGRAMLVLGFESAHHPVEGAMEVALEVARAHGGEPQEAKDPAPSNEQRPQTPSGPGGTRSWRPPTCVTRSSARACSARPSRRRSRGTGSRGFTRRSARPPASPSPRLAARLRTALARRSSAAASRMSIPTGRRPTTPSSARRSAAARSSSGTR